jgi:hypothetical protein
MKVSQICPATAGRILRGCLACDGGVQGPSLTGTARTARRGKGPFLTMDKWAIEIEDGGFYNDILIWNMDMEYGYDRK